MSIETILNRLDKVKSRGQGKYLACCPAHNDKTPSLSISELADGRILIKCFAGCGGAEILHAINLTLSELYPDGKLDEYRSFVKMEEDIQKRKQSNPEKNILKIAQLQRESGHRLSPADLERERQAYLRVRNATA